MDDAPDETPAPLKEDALMAHVDLALGRAHQMSNDLGPVNHSTLAAVLQSIRQAFARLIYGPPDPAEPTGESLDMLGEQRKAALQTNAKVEETEPTPDTSEIVEPPTPNEADVEADAQVLAEDGPYTETVPDPPAIVEPPGPLA